MRIETVEDAKETIEYLMSVYESGKGPLVYPVLLRNGINIGYVQLVPYEEGFGAYQRENRQIAKYVMKRV